MLIHFPHHLCPFPKPYGKSLNQRAEPKAQMYNQLLKSRKYMLALGRTLPGGLILMMEKF